MLVSVLFHGHAVPDGVIIAVDDGKPLAPLGMFVRANSF